MLAITVQQPWAWAIIHGGKDVENRTRIGTWRRAVGERICIHAGQRWSERGAASPLILRANDDALRSQGWERVGPLPLDAPLPKPRPSWFGAIIGTVVVADLHPEQGDCCQPWGEQSYVEHGGSKRVDIVHLVLEEPRPLSEPIPCRGALGLWNVQPWCEVIAREMETAHDHT